MTIQDILGIVWKKKILLIIITFTGTVLALIAGMVMNSNASKVSTIVEFQWTGITSGQFPDGSSFDYANLFESYVYASALDSLDITEVTTRQFRNALEVTPIIENSILEMIETELRNGNQISYFATEYKLTLKNGALDLSIDEGRSLLNRLLELFEEDFVAKYEKQTIISNYLVDDFTSFDYAEALILFKSQIAMIGNLTGSVESDANTFYSTSLGMTFNDIQIRTNNIENISLAAMESRINNYLLSKDSDMLVSKLKYKNEMNALELANKSYIKTELESYIAAYPGSTVTVIVSGADGTPLVIDTYLNTLYDDLLTVQNGIAYLNQQISYNQTLIDRYEGNDPLFIVDPVVQNAQRLLVEDDIVMINQQLNDITDDLDVIIKEYREYSNRLLVKQLVSPQYESEVSLLLYLVVGTIIGGGIGLVTIFIVDANQKKKAVKIQ